MSNLIEERISPEIRSSSKRSRLSSGKLSLQKSASAVGSGQSLLSARLTDEKGLLMVNNQGITEPAKSTNSVSKIAKDLLEFEAKRRPSTQSMRNQFLNNQTNFKSKFDPNYLSKVEVSILQSEMPIEIEESEEIEVNGEKGIWANKSEVINWRGELPIQEYKINTDVNPEILIKNSNQQIEYIQELAIRYLRPPTPPSPGEIIINQLPNELTAPAPPLIIRQQPARPETPEPLVIREAPPTPPAQIGRKVITISGKRIPPPPRKVVIERLAPLPPKPQAVIVERWLPYAEVKRRVIFQKPSEADPIVVKPRNVIVQWETPQVNVKKEFKYLGVIRANPVEYAQRYGDVMKKPSELPDFVLDIKTPDGLVLAAEQRTKSVHELEGDVDALNLIDLEKEGLAEYKNYINKLAIGKTYSNISRSVSAAQMSSSSSSKSSFSSLSNKSKKTFSNNLVNNSAFIQSASFVSQKAPSIRAASILSGRAPSVKSEKAASIHSQKSPSIISENLASNHSEKAETLRSNPASFIQASVPTQSRTSQRSIPRSIPVLDKSSSVLDNFNQEIPRLSQRSILKSASVVVQQPSFSTSLKNDNLTRSGASGLTFSTASGTKLPTLSSASSISSLIEKIFRSIDKDNKGRISVEDAEKILLRLNSRLGRRYGEDDVKILFATLDINNDGHLDLEEFKRAFLNLAN